MACSDVRSHVHVLLLCAGEAALAGLAATALCNLAKQCAETDQSTSAPLQAEEAARRDAEAAAQRKREAEAAAARAAEAAQQREIAERDARAQAERARDRARLEVSAAVDRRAAYVGTGAEVCCGRKESLPRHRCNGHGTAAWFRALVCQILAKLVLQCSSARQAAMKAQCHSGSCGLLLECFAAGAGC